MYSIKQCYTSRFRFTLNLYEINKDEIESFNCGETKEKSKKQIYLHKKSGDFDILILESDEEMGPRIVVEQKESNEKSKPVNILNKEILTLLDEINE